MYQGLRHEFKSGGGGGKGSKGRVPRLFPLLLQLQNYLLCKKVEGHGPSAPLSTVSVCLLFVHGSF